MERPVPPPETDALLDHVDGMRRLARRLVHDPALAEDVAHDAVLVALSKGPRRKDNVRGWLFGIVRNKAREHRRAEGRRVKREGNVPPKTTAPSTAEIAAQLAEQKRLLDAVGALPEPYRRAIWRRYFENLPPRKIAKLDAVPVETVRTWIKRGQKMLRDALDDAHGGTRRGWALALAPLAYSAKGPWLPTAIGGAVMSAKSKTAMISVLGVLLVCGVLLVLRPWSGAGAADSGSATDGASTEDARSAALEGRGETPGKQHTDADADAATFEVRGRVIGTDGQPIPDAELLAAAPEVHDVRRMSGAARTNADGSFHFRWSGADERIRVAARGAGRTTAMRVAERGDREEVVFRLSTVPIYTFRVLDAVSDAPISGAECVSRHRLGRTEWRATHKTDAQGIVHITSPVAHEMDYKLPIGFASPGYRPLTEVNSRGLGTTSGTRERPRDIYLTRAHPLRFIVNDDRGRPVEGAIVRGFAGYASEHPALPEWDMGGGRGATPPSSVLSLGEATTDAEGRAELTCPPAGAAWHAIAATEVMAAHTFGYGLRTTKVPEPHEIVLRPTVTVRGRVLDARGDPVLRARVSLTPWGYARMLKKGTGYPTPPSVVTRYLETMTDAEGEFELLRIPKPPVGEKTHVMALRGDLGATSETLESGSEPEVVLKLQFDAPEDTQSVRVVDERGQPVDGAVVLWRRILPGMQTGADGRAVLRRYPRQSGELIARHADGRVGHATAGDDGEEVVIELAPIATLEGSVRDPDERPVSVYVDVFRPEAADLPPDDKSRQLFGDLWLGRAHSDRMGQFRMENMPAGPLYVHVWHMPQIEGKHQLIEVKRVVEAGARADVVLPRAAPEPVVGATIEGYVVDAAGEEITEYIAYLREGKRTWASMLTGRRFRFEGVTPGEHTISVSAHTRQLKRDVPVVVRDGEDLSLRVVLAPTIELHGRLLDESGKPVAGAVLQLFEEGAKSWRALKRTDDEGRYVMKGLTPGRYRFRGMVNAGLPPVIVTPAAVELSEGKTPHVIEQRVAPSGTLMLELADAGFITVAEWKDSRGLTDERVRTMTTKLTVHLQSGEVWGGRGLFNGRTPFQYALPPGTHEVRVATRDGQTFRTTFTIEEGKETTVEVRLAK